MLGSAQQFLAKTYWGNTVGEWALSLFLILGVLLFSKFLSAIITRALKKLVGKTENTIDDAIFQIVDEPLRLIISLTGAWMAFGLLEWPQLIQQIGSISFYFVAVLSCAWILDRFFCRLFEEFIVPLTQKTETDLDDQLLPIAKRGVRTIIWAVAFIVGVDNAGYDIGAVLAGLGIGGLAFALAAQDTVSNLFGSITIFVDKPFKVGERVQVSGIDGVVLEIGTRSTRIRTLEGRIVTIPNSQFTDNAVTNVSSEPTRKVCVDLGLTYDTTPEQIETAIQILRNIVSETDSVLDDHYAWFGSFGDFSLGVSLIYYIKKDSPLVDTQTEVNLKIMREFAKANLEMAFPTQTLYHINQGQQAELKRSA